MKVDVTVKENYEFRRIYRKGSSSVQPALVVYCQKNRQGKSRLGVTVSVKIGKAHLRNHIRRQFREIYRLHKEEMTQGYDVIVVARGRTADTKYQQLDKQYLRALKQLNLLEGSNEKDIH